jgi:catalase
MFSSKVFTGVPVADSTNIMTPGRRGPTLLEDIWLIEKMAHFDREVRPRCRNGLVNVGKVNRPAG